ncbi:unnamed protein product [Symbiodinium natans]|uniref:Uncharacterized protein n=1 Tax=Symbiodinium natans TaxID=878477 RepID=A0A812UIQ4_9DINO|nr:unnamed protein product [Symbiodinium natans]
MDPHMEPSPARSPVARRVCPECEESRSKLKRAVVVIEALKARVTDLETASARRGAIGGRQRIGETLEEKVQSELERKDQEVRTMREAVIELSAQITAKEALLADCQERLAEAAARAPAAPSEHRSGYMAPPPAVEKHYPGGWRPPGGNITASSMSAAAFPVPPAASEAKEVSEPRQSRERQQAGEAEPAEGAQSLQLRWSQWVARATASSHTGLLHFAAISAAAKSLFEALGFPQEGALKLATVDCGPRPIMRVFARQSDDTAEIEFSEPHSRVEAEDAECRFLIFGFGGRVRSPPTDRAPPSRRFSQRARVCEGWRVQGSYGHPSVASHWKPKPCPNR